MYLIGLISPSFKEPSASEVHIPFEPVEEGAITGVEILFLESFGKATGACNKDCKSSWSHICIKSNKLFPIKSIAFTPSAFSHESLANITDPSLDTIRTNPLMASSKFSTLGDCVCDCDVCRSSKERNASEEASSTNGKLSELHRLPSLAGKERRRKRQKIRGNAQVRVYVCECICG